MPDKLVIICKQIQTIRYSPQMKLHPFSSSLPYVVDDSLQTKTFTPFWRKEPEAMELYLPSEDATLLEDFTSRVDQYESGLYDITMWLMTSFERLPGAIQCLLAINIAVWLAWQIVPKVMRKHAGASMKNFLEGRPWSLFFSTFSHASLAHLVGNMSVLVVVGPKVLSLLGIKLFKTSVAISAALTGVLPLVVEKITDLFHSRRVLPKEQKESVHIGFSGVGCTLLYLLAILKPSLQLTFVGQEKSLPITITSFVRNAVCFDVLFLLFEIFLGIHTGISHSGHVGGYLAGALTQHIACHTRYGRSSLKPRVRFQLQFFNNRLF